MKRRDFIALVGGAAAGWPLAAWAQQNTMPVVGFLRSTPSAPFQNLVVAFGQGLKEEGFVEGQNAVVDYRYADNQIDRLPALVADLIHRPVAVIVGSTCLPFFHLGALSNREFFAPSPPESLIIPRNQ